MPLPNGQIGVDKNPLKASPFVQSLELGVNFAPPGSEFRITNNGVYRITNDGDSRITNP